MGINLAASGRCRNARFESEEVAGAVQSDAAERITGGLG